ncbi:hypothetical protein HPB47_006032 [Ixodes persulcatus]|uniref:Uncharacterized protein n=1 Tax=Ixodes persulcatus TaxID=34615 RepID=A0AC60PBD7_IXOPE|nr:hypothetical protein HPB47_006032 [Ixodes persulcatus]
MTQMWAMLLLQPPFSGKQGTAVKERWDTATIGSREADRLQAIVRRLTAELESGAACFESIDLSPFVDCCARGECGSGTVRAFDPRMLVSVGILR